NVVETVRFNDGSTLSFDELKKMSMLGTKNNQTTIIGYDDMENIIKASQKDTTIQGGNKNDTLIGGTGNDTLQGGDGDDTYIFNLGDGKDEIYDING
ncbi:hypothetical protein O6B44_08545, partial [Campylobacter ureolyticus]|nr:hypothetical protein [Campylobacter ureolyticus]